MIVERIDALLRRMPSEPEFPTQGATLFVDLARRTVRRGYTPRSVVETFLEGRGGNMFYLYNLLDPSLTPLDPEIPLQFAAGLLTGIVPSAARGQVTGWSPETRVLMDSNCGDFFPSYMKLQGIDRLVLHGRPDAWTWLYLREGQIEFRNASPWLGLDNLDLRERVQRDLSLSEGKDMAMASIGVAGENLVHSAAIMGGPKACWARGGTGAKMGSLRLKAIVLHGFEARRGVGRHADRIKPYNRVIARRVLDTGVVRHALKVRGTPFLYKPSRLLGALGTLNNQQTTWTSALDAENIDPYRSGMAGCFRCPVKCRPLNDLRRGQPDAPPADRYSQGDGPEYVTLGKFGPMLGVERVEDVIRLNNICNDLGMDSATLGSSIAWAMELVQREIIGPEQTGGLDIRWGNVPAIEQLMFMTSRREGFGDIVADGGAAVDTGKYPARALDYRMAVKGLMQSDPHDSRIIKAFALGLAVATRGMDHLRNRVTLEINPKINDDPDYKRALYGGAVAAEPNSYEGKEVAVRTCEDTFAVGDAVGMCRFTTRLFNSPNLPGCEDFSEQLENVTGLTFTVERLQQIGRNIMGLERMINHSLGVRRCDDTLPARWFDEQIACGRYKGERIDRGAFEALLDRFYAISGLTDEGLPRMAWRKELAVVAAGFAVEVQLPSTLEGVPVEALLVTEVVRDVGEVIRAVERLVPGAEVALSGSTFAVAVNDEMLLSGRDTAPVSSGDRVEFMPALAGG